MLTSFPAITPLPALQTQRPSPVQGRVSLGTAPATGLVRLLPFNGNRPCRRVGNEFVKSRLHLSDSGNWNSIQLTGEQMAVGQKNIRATNVETELNRAAGIR